MLNQRRLRTLRSLPRESALLPSSRCSSTDSLTKLLAGRSCQVMMFLKSSSGGFVLAALRSLGKDLKRQNRVTAAMRTSSTNLTFLALLIRPPLPLVSFSWA